jgi:HK97 family phage portal protein
MAIRDLFGLRSTANPSSKSEIKAQLNPPVMDMPFSTWYGGNSYGGYNNFASAILRQDAVGVPSVSRCRNLICGTIATIPMEMYSLSTGEEIPTLTWIDQPDKRQPRSVTMAWTVDSLFMYGVAYWLVTEVYQDDNRPARFSWVQNDRVTVKYNALNTEVEYYMINNIRVPETGVGSLVTFQALDQGLLLRSQSTIRAALDIEKAAAIAAQTPQPSGYIKNNGADLPDQQVQGILNNWKLARQNRATAYLTSTLDYNVTQFTPKDMMYNEAKQYFATELARACNIPAYMIDAETFRGMTYQNIIDGRKEFFAYSLAPFVTAIESRLSMDDLTPRGQQVKFDLDDTFLRPDPATRIAVLGQMLTLGLIDVNQAKQMEGLSPEEDGEVEDESDL